MPEGDTIFRSARTMRAALVGREVTSVETTVPQIRSLGHRRLIGQTVADVEPRGKHLLHWFAPSDLALHSHMRMTGSWHVYREGERWRKPRHLAKFVLGAGPVTAVCFSAPVCELLARVQVERHPSLVRLGPDALTDDVDLAEARRRLDARAEMTAGEALLDQAVLAGVGNVYKNEVLFLHRIDPWTPVGRLDGDTRDALLATAVRLLRANTSPGSARRVTTGADRARGEGDRLHVYGKARRPCSRCSTPIRSARQGEQGRITYWCPRCQGAGTGQAGNARRPGHGDRGAWKPREAGSADDSDV
jgi:endonuclease-8